MSFNTVQRRRPLNPDILKNAYDQDKAVVCEHMAARERNQTETKLRRILRHLTNDGVDLRKSDVIQAFRELEEAGCGTYIEDRHGWPSPFVWDVKSVAIYVSSGPT